MTKSEVNNQKLPQEINLKPLNLYEDQLLNALAFFRTKREVSIQARHCLSMYLRDSEQRIMKEVEFYAYHCNMSDRELLDLMYYHPDEAQNLIEGILTPDNYQ
jgi:hypothetical protein